MHRLFFVLLGFCLFSLPLDAAEGSHWPEPVAPPDTLVYVEIAAPDRTLAAMQSFANSLLGFPIVPDLAEAFRSGLLGGITLQSVDLTRPIGLFMLGESFDDDPVPLGFFSVSDATDFERDFQQLYTGKSLLSRDGELWVYEEPDETRNYFKIMGQMVLVAEASAPLERLAGIKELPQLLSERKNPKLDGDVVALLLPRGMEALKAEIRKEIEEESEAEADADKAKRAAARRMLVEDMLSQPGALAAAVSFSGRDVGVALRLSPRAGSGLAAWVAANPGRVELSYRQAIPEAAVAASLFALAPESLRPLLDYMETRLFPAFIREATGRERSAEFLAAARAFLRDFTGEAMNAMYLADRPGDQGPRFRDLMVFGVRDVAAARALVDTHRRQVVPGLRDFNLLVEGSVVAVTREEIAGGLLAFHTTLASSPEDDFEHAVQRAMHGAGFSTYLGAGQGALVFSSDREMVESAQRRLAEEPAAPFHPLVERYPGPKWSMSRMSVAGLLQLVETLMQSAAEAGEDLPFDTAGLLQGMPAPPSGGGIFSVFYPRQGDLALEMLVPEAEIDFGRQMFMRAMMQGMQQRMEELGMEEEEEGPLIIE